MRDRITLSRDYFDEIINKRIVKVLDDTNISGMVKLSIIMRMLRFVDDIRDDLFGVYWGG